MDARLISKQGEQEFVLGGSITTIGRRQDNDICLPISRISRYHAEIRCEDGLWILEDHGSTYGTFLNGSRVEGAVALGNGDTIRFGSGPESDRPHFSFAFREGEQRDSVVSMIKRGVRKVVGLGGPASGKVSFKREDDRIVAHLTGVFRKKECDSFVQEAKEKFSEDPAHLVLDLSGVRLMNSYSLAALVDLGSQLCREGMELRITGARGTVLKLLTLAGEDSPFKICDGTGPSPT